MQVTDPLWQYLIIFFFGGISALLITRLVYGQVKFPSQKLQFSENLTATQLSSHTARNEFQITKEDSEKIISRQTLLPKETRIWYRRLHVALGVDHVIVPRVKLSRLVSVDQLVDINERNITLRLLRCTGVDFAICSANTLKVLAVVRFAIHKESSDAISKILNQASIPEILLVQEKEYSTSELRGIFKSKLLPPTARTLPIAV